MRRRTEAGASGAPLTLAALPWLLAGLALALAAHAPRLPWWLSGLFVLTAAYRWRVGRAPDRLPRQWQLVPITLMVIAGLLFSYGSLLGREAGVALLAAMAALKLLEARRARDGQVLIFLSLFLLLAQLLVSQSLFTAGYLLLTTVVLLNAQTRLQPQHAALPTATGLRLSGVMMAQAMPVMLLIFLLFPRIPGPLWSLPKDAHSGLTGLSESMTPGSISELIQSSEVAFRVRFDGPAPSASQLYWRGPVLWWYRNGSWLGREETLRPAPPYRPQGARLDYQVILEPHGRHWLFALDWPAAVPQAADGITATLQLKRRRPITERLAYSASASAGQRGMTLGGPERRRYLQLPAAGNLRARTLAAGWRSAANGDPAAVVRQALAYFRQQPFFYTLSPPLLERDGVDQFLFASRQGFCEHYAGSFVYLMRAAGIPARVVTGYQGGEPNGDYYIVRQSDAHAWAEVWLADDGRSGRWVRVDPTAAVAPQRVERGLHAAVDNPDELPLLARRGGALHQLALGWDRLQNGWNEWVLTYNNQRQRELLSGFGLRGGRDMLLSLVAALALVATVAGGWLYWRRRQLPDPLARDYLRLCSKLERLDADLGRRRHEGPLAYAERVAARLAADQPQLAGTVRRACALYARLRYDTAAPHAATARRQLRQLIAGLG